VRGMTTLDLAARLVSPDTRGVTKGLDVVLSLQNALNAKPDTITNPLLYDNPYDSTNYSPIGRFVAISVSKSW
jgi:iron complex outermembrane recepter protein